MTYDTKIHGMKFFFNDDGGRPFVKLATADIHFPDRDIALKSVTLAWSKRKGFTALAPYAFNADKSPAVMWDHLSPFALDLADKLSRMYLAMGGKSPAEPETTIDAEPDESGLRRFVGADVSEAMAEAGL